MEYALIRRLIEEGIVDFGKFVLANYKTVGLNETGAFIAIDLYQRSRKGVRLPNPEKLSKDLGIPADQVASVLETMMGTGLLKIEMATSPSGKETETFHLDNLVVRILADYERRFAAVETPPKAYATTEEEIVDMLETGFQKQLTPIEIEIIRKWVGEDRFEPLEIRRAVLDSVKANKHTLSYVDTLLVKRRQRAKGENPVKYDAGQPEALKNFFDTWPKK
ncbi:MAG: DnaD domain protein [Candidatus Izemoplasmatales bacterium]